MSKAEDLERIARLRSERPDEPDIWDHIERALHCYESIRAGSRTKKGPMRKAHRRAIIKATTGVLKTCSICGIDGHNRRTCEKK